MNFIQFINKAESESNNKVVFEAGILSNLIQRILVGQGYRQAFQRFIPISVSAFILCSFRHSVSAFYPNPFIVHLQSAQKYK